MIITFLESVPIADNIRTFRFKPKGHVAYTAGQYIELTVPHENPDERGIKHWFTLSSSPSEDHLAITTKFAEPSSTFKNTLLNLKPGAELEMAAPEGDFVLPDDPKLELIFVAGGIGVTPYRSMVKYLADKGEKRKIKLVYGVASQDELAFEELFTDYGVELVPFVGQRLTADIIMQQIGKNDGKLVFVSGPEPMVEALHDSLITAGLPADSLKSDYFPNYENTYSA
jgi:ferredoxin-NADP reductase